MPNLDANISSDTLHGLIEEWTNRLAEVIESMTQERPGGEWIRAAEAPPASENLLSLEQAVDLAPGAALYVAAPEDSWTEIGKRALVAAGIEDADLPTVRSTYLEIVSQAMAALVRAMGSCAGRELLSQPSREVAAPAEVSSWYLTRLRFRDSAPLSVFLGLNPAAEAPFVREGCTAREAQPAAQAAPFTQPESKTLDLLLDVELPVSVSFGRAELLLKDVLKLATGSIVELNRSISEPVDVIVNNCVIARGEVVVIEGNYGIRISQIISRQERLRTLK